MPLTIVVLRWILRIAFLISFALGCALWAGRGYAYLQFHMWLGFIITFTLLAIVILSLIARVKPALPLIALLWAVALPIFGIAQLRLMPGPNHWIVRVVHLILGLGAIGLGESLCKRIRLRSSA
jgi:uncharacterized membrane protein YczE